MSQVYPDVPCIPCFTEHHQNYLELKHVCLENYNLGAKYCRLLHGKRGVAIYVHDSLRFININLMNNCIEQDIELCALKLHLNSVNICVLTIYKAPAGNVNCYTQNRRHFVYLVYCNSRLYYLWWHKYQLPDWQWKKNQLDTLLFSYNLSDIIKFPGRVQKNSVSAIDNIFIAISQMGNCTAIPVVNGSSYHNAQLLTISGSDIQIQSQQLKTVRKVNKYRIPDFLTNLSYETWDITLVAIMWT